MLNTPRGRAVARRLGTGAALAIGLTMLGGVLGSATAGGGCDGVTGCGGGGGSVEQTGHTVTVQVSGTFVGGGSAGSPGSTTVSVPTPCWYTESFSGKEYADWIDSGKAAQDAHHHGDAPTEIYPGYEQHKNDADGHWYGGECISTSFGDDMDAFFKYSDAWFKDHGTVWVPAGGQPPTPPVPPTVLRDAALQAMKLPEPTFDWNPKANGGSSVVNLDTWFWLDDNIDNGNVTASAGGNTATVTADRQSVSFSAPTAGAVDCADGGTPWSPDAKSDCVLYYREASDGTPTTAAAHWGLSWTFNGAPQGALDPIDAQQTENVGVFEVQTINRDPNS